MPTLKRCNPNASMGLFHETVWIVWLTTDEDIRAAEELKLDEKVETILMDEREARSILGKVNNRANQIRNPSYIYDRPTMRR